MNDNKKDNAEIKNRVEELENHNRQLKTVINNLEQYSRKNNFTN